MPEHEYTPSDEQMHADWHAYITTPDPENYYPDALSTEEADARWSRWLAAHDAQVKRDAAREAVHGLVARWVNEFGASDAYVDMIRDEASDYLSENYPEETP